MIQVAGRLQDGVRASGTNGRTRQHLYRVLFAAFIQLGVGSNQEHTGVGIKVVRLLRHPT